MAAKRILVVDDEATIAKLVELIVRSMGYEVDTAANGAEALQKIGLNRPDLLILDLIMPVMTGEELIQEVQGNPDLADIPIILLSTRQSARGYKKDAFLMIPKPFDPADVKSVVRRVLGDA